MANGRIIAFILATAFAFSASAEVAAGEIELGMNYNWWRFVPRTQSECRAHPASPFRGNWILPHYANQEIRTTVQRQLREMREAGFTLLKIIIYHRRPNLGQDKEFFFSEDGSIAQEDKIKLRNFVADIAVAGFRALEVAFGFIDQNAPLCRHERWGDCFEPQRTEENFRFISEATRAVVESKGGLSVIFDLTGEGACPAANMDARTLLNTKRYVQTIAARWQSQFGDNWVMACPNSPKATRLALLVEYLTEAGIYPKHIEIHNYETDRRTIYPMLDAVEKVAERINASAILGEMQYDSLEKATILADWLKGHPRSRFSAMIAWPLRNPTKGGCAMDTAPPYAPGPLATIKGN